jgi:hypothetical protein
MVAKAFKIVGVNILFFLGLLTLLEGTGQLIAVIRPSYEVLFLQPDEVLGWKQVPNLRWTWAGTFWYAADFSVDVETNPLGFRDLPREFFKPQGVARVALLGDSFIEAVQVPLAKTAAQLLERRLNASLGVCIEQQRRWEVLNFGVSGFGVGQCLLAWEQYASRFDADYVAIFVAMLHMKRTVDKYRGGPVFAGEEGKLWTRPTFRIDNESLIREPAQDFDRFVKAQEDRKQTDFAGKRMRRRETRLLTLHYARRLRRDLGGMVRSWRHTADEKSTPRKPDLETGGEVLAVNVKIIEELGREVDAAGSRLVVLDASQYFGDDESVSRTLNECCTEHGFGYIPLHKDLSEANANGISTKWAHDGHFNEAGNRILADALYGWIAETVHASE